MMCIHPKRVHIFKSVDGRKGPVAYWMSRDQRILDNWALLYAQQLAIEKHTSLITVFCLADHFLGAPLRAYDFMLRGLELIEHELMKYKIPFYLLRGNPIDSLSIFIEKNNIGSVITDFDPLRVKLRWKSRVIKNVNCSFYEVDAHNVVPCRWISKKVEYGAYTLRPKIQRWLPDFLTPIPALIRHPFAPDKYSDPVDWRRQIESLKLNRQIQPVDWLNPGHRSARECLKCFIEKKLSDYNEIRNDPTRDGQSNLSPYLHFGQLSAQRVALEVESAEITPEKKASFLEELIVRRELSDNYCLYDPDYDSLSRLPNWARQTLDLHKHDIRGKTYSFEEFENGSTHEPLWNAAQKEMILRGKMHGYMRMYWAKKIFEWSHSAEEALQTAIALNDKYSLDGRDPNGYTGIAWSIGGVHDRPWAERPVFGKIRYMSYYGARRKFDVEAYIRRWMT
jgi:deoxyribodipyrimidine photo-lyase